MTTEELYELMRQQFERLESRMEAGFEDVNKRLENIETRLGSVENDVAWIKGKLEGTQEGRAGVWQIVTTATAVGAVIIALIALFK